MKKITILLLLLCEIISLIAVPACPEPMTVENDNHENMTVYLKGDENRSWYETVDGLHLIQNANGLFEYVKPGIDGYAEPSGVIAHAPGCRDRKELDFILEIPDRIVYKPNMLKLQTRQAPAVTSDLPFNQCYINNFGKQKFLVILVEFSDVFFTHTRDDFDSLFNGKHYDYNGAIGSVNAYYKAASFGQFDPQFDVVGPIRLDNGYAYYGSNDYLHLADFVFESAEKADPIVDYTLYNNDSDRCIDNVYLVYAGYGECFAGADTNTIWPHRSMVGGTRYDDMSLWDYSTSMEFFGTSGTIRTPVGVVCHEFGHVCGLWDLYDTDYDGNGGDCGGLGSWDVMAYGSWNDRGKRPPIFNAWARMFLKWEEPLALDKREKVVLNPAHSHGEARYLLTDSFAQYFFFENRQQEGWDAAIPGHGMLVYHIDRGYKIDYGDYYYHPWAMNEINSDPYRQCFDLEEADGLGNITRDMIDAGDAYPGTSGRTYFMDTGTPNAISWEGNPSNGPIRNIQENSGVITFSFGDPFLAPPSDVRAAGVSEDSIRISWALNAGTDSVLMVWGTNPLNHVSPDCIKYDIGDSLAGGKVLYKGIDTVFVHTGLETGTAYHYAIYAFNDSLYSDGVNRSVKTWSLPYYSADFSGGLPEGWVISDIAGNGAFTFENPENRRLSSTTGNNGFILIDSEHAGNTRINTELITQAYNFELCYSVEIMFEHFFEKMNNSTAQFFYSTDDGCSWIEAMVWMESTQNPDVFEKDLSSEIAGLRDVKFKFKYSGENDKFWCIDDFSIKTAQNPGLSAGFHTVNTIGSKPLTVRFLNTTACLPDTVDSYTWDFGDNGEVQYGKEAIHTYFSSGYYTVTMTANVNEDISVCRKENYIHVLNDPPVAVYEDEYLNLAKSTPSMVNTNELFMDPNNDPMTFSWSGNSGNLDITLQNDSTLLMIPATDYLGKETIVFVAKDIDNDSTAFTVVVWVSETGLSEQIPDKFDCGQNYPNPFNPVTMISYQIPEAREVNLNIYDLSGKKVRTLINCLQDAGYYTIHINASDLSSGIYIYRLQAGEDIKTMKMILIK